MKLVDVPDSKSGVVHPTCRFDSGLRQTNKTPYHGSLISFVDYQELRTDKAKLCTVRAQAEQRVEYILMTVLTCTGSVTIRASSLVV